MFLKILLNNILELVRSTKKYISQLQKIMKVKGSDEVGTSPTVIASSDNELDTSFSQDSSIQFHFNYMSIVK